MSHPHQQRPTTPLLSRHSSTTSRTSTSNHKHANQVLHPSNSNSKSKSKSIRATSSSTPAPTMSSSVSSTSSCVSFNSSIVNPNPSSSITDPNYECCFKDTSLLSNTIHLPTILTPLQYYVATQCGHVLCLDCGPSSTKDMHMLTSFVCPVCEMETTVAPITNSEGEVYPIFKSYFTPFFPLFETTLEASRFQQANLTHLVDYLKSKISHHRQLLQKAKKELVAYKELKQKYSHLEMENSKLRTQLQRLSSSHPYPPPSSSSSSSTTSYASSLGFNHQFEPFDSLKSFRPSSSTTFSQSLPPPASPLHSHHTTTTTTTSVPRTPSFAFTTSSKPFFPTPSTPIVKGQPYVQHKTFH